MKSPQLAGSAIPWSAETEAWLRHRMVQTWIRMWLCFAGGVSFAIPMAFLVAHTWLNVAIGSLCTFAFLVAGFSHLLKLNGLRDLLGEEMHQAPNGPFYPGSGMLAHKPRSLRNLTTFIQHAPSTTDFMCGRCGQIHFWKDATWYPNYDESQFDPEDLPMVDPAGGRFVILCGCGVGHFKLKVSS